VSDRELVLRKLKSECAARGVAIEYPAKICRVQYKCQLEEASPNQLWQLVFTVRNRRKKTGSRKSEVGSRPMEAAVLK
jgi:hypothetical protein